MKTGIGLILSIVISLLLITSCKTSKKTVDVAVAVPDTLSDYSSRKLLRSNEIYTATTDVVPLDSVYISKDTLHFMTKRILGCDEENFSLIWDGKIRKSLPPIASVKLLQKVDPACKERHYFHLTYNVKSLQLKNDSIGWSKVTVIKVGGWQNIMKYEF